MNNINKQNIQYYLRVITKKKKRKVLISKTISSKKKICAEIEHVEHKSRGEDKLKRALRFLDACSPSKPLNHWSPT